MKDIQKKLFTKKAIVIPQFFSAEKSKKIADIIFNRKDIFASDVEPQYGSLTAYYGMIEAGLNESYYRYAGKHNKTLQKLFPALLKDIKQIGQLILKHSGLQASDIPVVPRDINYFLIGGFNIQKKSWLMYNVHTDTEGLIQYPASIFDENTRAYSCVISIKRSAQYKNNNGGELDIWNKRFMADQMDDFYCADGYRVKKKYEPFRQTIDYSEGNLVLFDSFMPHVVLPFTVKNKNDYRITFVCHFNYRKWTEQNPYPHIEFWY